MVPRSHKRLSPDGLLGSFDSEDSIVAPFENVELQILSQEPCH